MPSPAGTTITMFNERADRIEGRLAAAEDRSAIIRLLFELQGALNDDDPARATSFFSEAGEWCDFDGRAIGRHHIFNFLRGLLKPITKEAERSFRSLSDIVVSLEGDTGTAGGQWRLYSPDDAGQVIIEKFGHFDVVLNRTVTGWKIRRWASSSLLPYVEQQEQPGGSREANFRSPGAEADASDGKRPPHARPAADLDIEALRERLYLIGRRVGRLADVDAVHRLFLDVQSAMDTRDLDAYGQLYTSDGEWCAVNGRAVGPDNITEHLKQYCKPWENERQRTYHSIGDVMIDLDGNVGKGRGEWQHFHPGPEGLPVIKQLGRFEALVRRTPNGWRFVRRASYATIPFVEPKYQLPGLQELRDDEGCTVEPASQSSSREGDAASLVDLQARLDQLDQTLQLVEDRTAIYRQFIKLQNATDTRDPIEYGECFTEDGEWSGVSGKAVGRASIVRHMSEFMTPWESSDTRTFHSISDAMIDIEGDAAQARVQYRHYKLGPCGRPIAFQFCHYDADLARTADGWLFKRRASFIDIPFIEPIFQVDAC